MRFNAWKLPWQNEMVPHAVLDILRGCNISCRACYNVNPPVQMKSLKEIEEELDGLLRYRRLSSVSIVGGEVALHPNLADIIAMVRAKGLRTELVSNGFAIDTHMMKTLADAGLDIIYFHIERGQKRSDLPGNQSFDDINRLRREKASLAASFGVDVGLTLTIYPGEIEELQNTVSFFLATPEINYILITLFRNTESIESLKGDIFSGLYGTGKPDKDGRDMKEVAFWFENNMRVKPFAYVGSNLDQNDPRWLSYLVGVVYESDKNHHYHYLQASVLEKLIMFFYKAVVKRYPMYMEQNEVVFRRQLLLNGLLTANYKPLSGLFKRSKKKDTKLRAKRILIQNPAELDESGKLIHCSCCPDAVLKNGTLVPVCIADKVAGLNE